MKIKNQIAGFSMIEVALALVVLAVGVTAILGLFPATLSNNRKVMDRAEMGLQVEHIFATLDAVADYDWDLLTENGVNNIKFAGGPDDPHITQSRVFRTGVNINETRIQCGDVELFEWTPGNAAGTLQNFTVTRFTYILDIDDSPPEGVINGENYNLLRKATLYITPGDKSRFSRNELIEDPETVKMERYYFRGYYGENL